MVWVDTDGLRALGASLDTQRETLVPTGSAPDGDYGFAALASACSDFDAQGQRTQVVQSQEIDALASGAISAAQQWEHTEQLLSGTKAR